MLLATKRATNPHDLESPSNSETALWGEAQHETLQEPPKLGLCSSLGPCGCILEIVGEADEKWGHSGGPPWAELAGVPFPHPCHTGQDCFLAISSL